MDKQNAISQIFFFYFEIQRPFKGLGRHVSRLKRISSMLNSYSCESVIVADKAIVSNAPDTASNSHLR